MGIQRGVEGVEGAGASKSYACFAFVRDLQAAIPEAMEISSVRAAPHPHMQMRPAHTQCQALFYLMCPYFPGLAAFPMAGLCACTCRLEVCGQGTGLTVNLSST